MASLALPSKTAGTHLFARAAVFFLGVSEILQAWQNRRAAGQLAGLDPHMLADIGLNRGDVSDALSQPLWRDPTILLAGRVHERRANRRRAVGFDGNLMSAPPLVPRAEGEDRLAKIG
jgi:uncharacterized protein YjiS (DUF1127 family)